MSVLTAMQSASVRLIGQKPSVFFSSQNTFEMEMVDLVNEVAAVIVDAHSWQGLTKIHTISGDGSTTAFALPSDYDRMVVGQSVHDANTWFWNYTSIQTLDEWITVTSNGFGALTPGWWIILENQLQFYPAPSSGQAARFPYISRNYARPQTGSDKPQFDRDDDTFLLDERLLTLGLIWRWREQKRLDATGDQENFEAALSEKAARDRGSRVIRKGTRVRGDIRIAWPWELG